MNLSQAHFVVRGAARGATLVIFMLLVAVSMAIFIWRLPSRAQIEQQKILTTDHALREARVALLGYALTAQPTGLGSLMVCPDRANDLVPNFDGTMDSPCTTGTIRIGQLPWRQAAGCGTVTPVLRGLAGDWKDAWGNRLWYAVSRNMTEPSAYGSLTPDAVTAPTYPWITVRNAAGTIISNRVAAVIIAPGHELAGQNRSGAVLNAQCQAQFSAGIGNYLESRVTPLGTISNQDMDECPDIAACSPPAMTGEDFIVADSTTQFNDRLVFITADELLAKMDATRSAAKVAKQALVSYYTASSGVPAARYLPYAASLGANPSCVEGAHQGTLPIPVCMKTPSAIHCTEAGTYQFTRSVAANFTANAGACVRATNRCTCTGAGSCSAGAVRFSCDAAGTCTMNSTGTVQFTRPAGSPAFSSGYSDPAPSQAVSYAGTVCTAGYTARGACTGAAVASSCSHPLPLMSTLPDWFVENNWAKYFTYHVAPSCDAATKNCTGGPWLSLGNDNKVPALLISVGPTIAALPFPPSKGAAQVRPSLQLKDYLDAIENANGDSLFLPVKPSHQGGENDQTFPLRYTDLP